MTYGEIYVATNLFNGKQYVGQTIQGSLIRIQDHWKAAMSGVVHPFYSALRKYGKGNFKFEVIWSCPDQGSLNSTEIALIELLNTQHPNGYNLRLGGSKGRHNQATRSLMSKVHLERFSLPGSRDRYIEAAKTREANPVLIAKRAATRSDPAYQLKHASATRAALNRSDVKERHVAAVRKASQDEDCRKARRIITTALWQDSNHRQRRLQSLDWGNRIWINDGTQNRRIRSSEPIPDGWQVGRYLTNTQRARISDVARTAAARPEVKERQRAANREAQNRPEVVAKKREITLRQWDEPSIWITNGVSTRRISATLSIPDGWIKGRQRRNT